MVLTVVASLLNVVLLVVIALAFAKQGWPEECGPWIAFSIGLMLAVPIVNLIALWHPRRIKAEYRRATGGVEDRS